MIVGEFLLIGWLYVGAERIKMERRFATQLECETEGRKLDTVVGLLSGIEPYARVYWGCEREKKTP